MCHIPKETSIQQQKQHQTTHYLYIYILFLICPIHYNTEYDKIKVTDDVTIFDILDNRDQDISNVLVSSQAAQSVVTYVDGESGKHS